jgi:hypothetical protein
MVRVSGLMSDTIDARDKQLCEHYERCSVRIDRIQFHLSISSMTAAEELRKDKTLAK